MERKLCEECGGKIIKQQVDYVFLGENLGKFPAEVCTKCGEKVFEEEVSRKISETAKIKGLWGLNDHTKINRLGGSFGITISKKIAQFLNIKKGGEVIIYPENKKKLVVQII